MIEDNEEDDAPLQPERPFPDADEEDEEDGDSVGDDDLFIVSKKKRKHQETGGTFSLSTPLFSIAADSNKSLSEAKKAVMGAVQHFDKSNKRFHRRRREIA